MRHYKRSRGGSGKIKTILLRIAFVITAAIVITLLTVLLGHYLKNKADGISGAEDSTDSFGNQISREPASGDSASYHSETVFGVGVNMGEFSSPDEISRIVAALSQYYDTLSIRITESDCTFKYTSPALCEYLRVPTPTDNNAYSVLEGAITAANALGMRTCIIMDIPDFESESALLTDSTVARELSSLGADEILIIPAIDSGSYIDYNTAHKLRSYFGEISERLGKASALGIVLPAQSYSNVSNEKQLQMIASAVSFMAIDMSSRDGVTPDEMYKETTETISSLLGTFGTYNMRMIFTDTDRSLLAAAYTASVKSNINNICFTHTVTPEQLTYTPSAASDAPQSGDTETASGAEDDHTNPYAAVQSQNGEEETEAAGSNPWY